MKTRDLEIVKLEVKPNQTADGVPWAEITIHIKAVLGSIYGDILERMTQDVSWALTYENFETLSKPRRVQIYKGDNFLSYEHGVYVLNEFTAYTPPIKAIVEELEQYKRGEELPYRSVDEHVVVSHLETIYRYWD